MISLIIITIIFLGFFIYVIYLSKSNKENFEKQKGIIEIISILVGVWYIIFSVYSSNDSFDQTQQNFNELVTNLKNLTSISAGSKSSLDSVRQDLINLPIEINKLSKTIKSIDAIVDSQKVLWVKQYELQKNEFNKKPKITFNAEFISNDSMISCNQIDVINDGDDAAKILSLAIMLKKEHLIDFSTTKLNMSLEKEDEEYKYYKIQGESISPSELIPKRTFTIATKLFYKKIEGQRYSITIGMIYISNYSSGESSKVFDLLVKNGEIIKIEYSSQK